MGMIWNSPATLAMIDTVNTEFSTNIAKWQGLQSLFDPANSGNNYELKNIASSQGLYGAGLRGSQADDNWQTWLGHLGTSSQPNSNHEKLRRAIFNGLDGAYDLIMFQVVPLAHGNHIKVTAYPDADDRIMGVLIETPTFDQVAQVVRRVARRRRLARAKAKTKAAKKKAAKKKHQ